MIWPTAFTSVINVGLSIAAIVLMALLIQNNVSQDVNRLQAGTMELQTRLVQAESGADTAVTCSQVNQVLEASRNACIDAGNTECSNLTTTFIGLQDALVNTTVNQLTERMNQVADWCTNQTQLLRSLIAQVVPDTNLPVLITSGTTSQGWKWELYQFTVSGLSFRYLSLLPWTASHAGSNIVYDNLPIKVGAMGSRFLLKAQQAKWSEGVIESVDLLENSIIFTGVSGPPYRLGQRLVING